MFQMNIKRIAFTSLFCTMSLHVFAGQSAPPSLQGPMSIVTSGVKVEPKSTTTSTSKSNPIPITTRDNPSVTVVLSEPGELPEVSLETKREAGTTSSPPPDTVTTTVTVRDVGGNVVDTYQSFATGNGGLAEVEATQKVMLEYQKKYNDGAWD
jgi:hypothetical protein